MSFKLAPLSDFIRYSDKTPMTAKEYQATTRPKSSSTLPADSKTAPQNVSAETSSPKERMKTYMQNLASQIETSSSASLVSSIGSTSLGASGGLYNAVGQASAAEMQSLIRRYA